MLIRIRKPARAGTRTHMDKGRAMTGLNRHIRNSLGLLLLTGLATGCATTPPWAPVTAEEIPAQVCGGGGDTDGDGVTDCYDRCPDTMHGQPVDEDGCPLPEPEPKPFRG
jgi:hypothetical protein